MNAKNILLTHFSARYPKFPPEFGIVDPSTPSSPRSRSRSPPRPPVVAAAFDCSKFRIGDMWKLSMYMPAIEQCFHETKEEGEDEEVVASEW